MTFFLVIVVPRLIMDIERLVCVLPTPPLRITAHNHIFILLNQTNHGIDYFASGNCVNEFHFYSIAFAKLNNMLVQIAFFCHFSIYHTVNQSIIRHGYLYFCLIVFSMLGTMSVDVKMLIVISARIY